MLVGFVALVVIAVALAYLARRHITKFFLAYFPFLNRIQGALRKYRVKAKIVVTFFQIISQYAGGIIAIPWPPVYERIAGSFDVLNFNVASLATASCAVTTSYYDKLLFMTLAPLALSCLIFAYYAYTVVRLTALEADTDGDGRLSAAEITAAF